MLDEEGAHSTRLISSFQDIVDYTEKLVIIFIEKYRGGPVFHFVINLFNNIQVTFLWEMVVQRGVTCCGKK